MIYQPRRLYIDRMSNALTHLYKPAVVGGMTAVAVHFLTGGARKLNVMGNYVDGRVVGAALGAAGVVVNDQVHNLILPHINHDARAQNMESMLLGPAINGALLVGLFETVSPGSMADGRWMKFAAAGAGADVAGQHLYEAVVSPKTVDARRY